MRRRKSIKVECDGTVYSTGPRMVSLDAVNWYGENTPMGMFVDGVAYLDWVARGCPMWRVSSVDEDSGTLTIEVE